MAQQLNPYLTFQGNCAEAMDFYAAALGGTVQVMTFRDSGMDADGVMHAALETPAGFHLFAEIVIQADMHLLDQRRAAGRHIQQDVGTGSLAGGRLRAGPGLGIGAGLRERDL